MIVRELLSGPKRFTEIRVALHSSSAKTLTDRLRALEHQQILTRTVHAEVPPRVVYQPTEHGESLSEILSPCSGGASNIRSRSEEEACSGRCPRQWRTTCKVGR